MAVEIGYENIIDAVDRGVMRPDQLVRRRTVCAKLSDYLAVDLKYEDLWQFVVDHYKMAFRVDAQPCKQTLLNY